MNEMPSSRFKERIARVVRGSVLPSLQHHQDAWIAAAIASVYVAWLLRTARSLGFCRDEGFYFSAATAYQKWFALLARAPRQALEQTAIDAAWTHNHEHPSLMKSLFALSHLFLHDAYKWVADDSTAFRLPGMLMMGLAMFVTYMFAREAYSRRAAVVAALALGLMPRVFYHAHLACFDVPIMAMWCTCVYVYWRAEKEGSWGWALATGVVYGLTLETKHNAWMLPAVVVPHALLIHGRVLGRYAARRARLVVPMSLVAMATVGPALFVVLWPWMWHDTLNRLEEYVKFHVFHEYYNIEFLGRTYFGPPSPRSYMPVMIAATVPTATLVLFAVGGLERAWVYARNALAQMRVRTFARREDNARFSDVGVAAPRRLHTEVLFFLAMAVSLGPFLLPRTPIFGGTKHWMTAYPFLAIVAGRGFDVVAAHVEKLLPKLYATRTSRALMQCALVSSALSGAFATTWHSHPFGLSSYVPMVGGTAGGADLGLNRQFWGFTTQSLGSWLEKNTKPGDTFYFMDTSWPAWTRMVAERRVPSWLRGVSSPAEATWSIVHHEQHMNEVDYNIWTEYGSSTPAYVLTHDGVPIISVYRRDLARPGDGGSQRRSFTQRTNVDDSSRVERVERVDGFANAASVARSDIASNSAKAW